MNELKVNVKQAITALHTQGWSSRKIARELGVDRATVRRTLAKAAIPLTGSKGISDSNAAICKAARGFGNF